MRKRTNILVGALILIVAGCWYLSRPVPASNTPFNFGVSFSSRYAKELGIDPSWAYLALLEDIGVKRVRLSAYWDEIEPVKGQYNFSELDWQMNEAAKHRTKVVLAIGRKLPRWPECFIPAWVNSMDSVEENKRALVSMVNTVAIRYKDHPALAAWQVENEPFVIWFGECPFYPSASLLKKEIATVRAVSSKPIVITDSGELATWAQASRVGDIFGSTLYRYTWNKYFGYGTYPLPPGSYRLKARLNGLNPANVWISEMQAEPWGPGKGLYDTPVAEQLQSFPVSHMEDNIAFAKQIGARSIYLWGGEWWYWMKEKQSHPEYWQAAKKIFQGQ